MAVLPILQTMQFTNGYLTLQTFKKSKGLQKPILTVISEFIDLPANDFRWMSLDGQDMTEWVENSQVGGCTSAGWTLEGGFVLSSDSWTNLVEEFPFLEPE